MRVRCSAGELARRGVQAVTVHVHSDWTTTLDDPNTFNAFHVSAPGLTTAEVASGVGGDATETDDEHVWIPLSRLYELGTAPLVASRTRCAEAASRRKKP